MQVTHDVTIISVHAALLKYYGMSIIEENQACLRRLLLMNGCVMRHRSLTRHSNTWVDVAYQLHYGQMAAPAGSSVYLCLQKLYASATVTVV